MTGLLVATCLLLTNATSRLTAQSATDYVIGPLTTVPNDPALQRAITQYRAAPEKTQTGWGEAYAKPLEEYEAASEEDKTPPKSVKTKPGAVARKASKPSQKGELVS